jgi:ABC-2 type transport system ATP-binding protein
MTELAIACRALTRRFPDILAVDHLDLEVRAGECLAVLGPNGAGKTTTVEMIEGLTEPTSGEISVFGHTWGRSRAEDQKIRALIGVQLQESFFQERLTIAETIDLFASFYPRARPTDELIGLVSLEAKADGRVGKLSGGQRQRLALACALVGHPRLLCLDEPTTGLDPQSRRQIWDIVQRFLADGGTVLLTTHYMEEAEQLAHRVAIMDHGKLIACAPPTELIASLGAEDIVTFDCDTTLPTDALQALPAVSRVKVDAIERGHRVRLSVRSVADLLPALLALLNDQHAKMAQLSTHRATLEDVFIHHTGRGLRDA